MLEQFHFVLLQMSFQKSNWNFPRLLLLARDIKNRFNNARVQLLCFEVFQLFFFHFTILRFQLFLVLEVVNNFCEKFLEVKKFAFIVFGLINWAKQLSCFFYNQAWSLVADTWFQQTIQAIKEGCRRPFSSFQGTINAEVHTRNIGQKRRRKQ
jgi:hypothetical protein